MRHIALLTDFGTRDPYVAAMKGVIASRTAAAIHDLTHEIAPFDVFEAAWFLRAVVKYWSRTVFVCVVDPGVGTSRRIVAVESGGNVFLAPDNGLLTFVGGPAHSIENDAFFLPEGSNTFHGRDRFAPVAAELANGRAVTELGPPAESLVRLPYDEPSYGETVTGTIVGVDRFGNCITDVEVARLPFARFALRVGGVTIGRLECNYGDAAPGPFLIAGSGGRVEISIANGSAASELRLKRLDRVTIIA